MKPSLLRRRTGLFGGLVGASLAQGFMAIVATACVQRIVDGVLVPGAASPTRVVALVVLVFAASALIGAAIEIVRVRAAERLGLGYVAELREALYVKIMNASSSTLGEKGQGSLLLPFVGDLTAIKKWVSDGLVRVIAAAAMSVLLLGMLYFQNPLLAYVAGSVMALAALAMVWLSGALNVAIRTTRAKRGAVASFVSASIRGAGTVQMFYRLRRELRRLQRRSDALMEAGLRLATVSGAMSALVQLAGALLVAGTLAVAVFEMRRGEMSIGVVVAAISVVGLLSGAIRDLGVGFELWRRAKVSFAKVEKALALAPSVTEAAKPRRMPGEALDVVFRRVSIAGLFDSVSLRAVPGEVVNVVGPSGSGRSTLLALAARMRDADSGQVRIGGRNVQAARIDSLRRSIGVASATLPLLPGSLDMNLRYRLRRPTADALAEVVEVCRLQDIFGKFQQGAEARLTQGAPELSVAERQRLMIARAMLGRPQVLVLDDFDSHLDPETAASVAKALSDYEGVVLMAATNPILRCVATVNWRIEDKKVHVEPNNAVALANDREVGRPELKAGSQ